jgi:hypothetical protein
MARRRGQTQKKDVEWDFLSFPVYFGFFIGALVSFFAAAFAPGIVFIVALFGVSFCTAHAISHWFRNRTIDKRLQRAEEDERERRALAAHAANAAEGEAQSPRRRRRRNRG